MPTGDPTAPTAVAVLDREVPGADAPRAAVQVWTVRPWSPDGDVPAGTRAVRIRAARTWG